MLQFQMETKRINEIINIGAKSRINDMEFLEMEVRKFLASPDRQQAIEGALYYGYEQAIKEKKRLVIAENGELKEDKHLPNNRFLDNQYAKMVDQKVNYILAKPLTFKTENEQYAAELKKLFGKGFHKMLKDCGKDSYNSKIGWIHPYYGEQAGELKFKRFRPWEILPFWKDDEHIELDFVVRVYDVATYEGREEKMLTFVDVYDTNGIHRLLYSDGALKPDYSTYYFDMPDEEGTLIPYNWERVPFIAFKANSEETPLLKKCKSLQDGINWILSTFGDGMQENASGNSILIIQNYGGEDLGVFRQNISQYKAVKVNTIDGAKGGVDKLEIEVNCDNYKSILQELRKALIQNCKGYDVEELKSSGSPNEMTIKAIFSDIDLDANELETEFQAAFEQLLWFVNMHLKNTGKGDFTNEEVEVIFNRDMMVNESQVITDINNSVDLSRRTRIANHPWITDVDAELEQLKQEQEEALEQYGNAFVKKPFEKEDGEMSGEEE